MTDRYRFVVLGTGGSFTRQVITSLIDKGCYPVAYIQASEEVVADKRSFAGIELEVNTRERLGILLQRSGVACHYNPGARLQSLLRRYQAHFLLVACWPWLLPASVLSAVSLAALNLHPSLLPDFRGPDPIGDQLQSQHSEFGVSLHLINERFDRGDIVSQQPVAVLEPTAIAIETATAIAGAGLFVDALCGYRDPGWQLVKQA